jgi:thiol-disulfide isomerase/thioredoxin
MAVTARTVSLGTSLPDFTLPAVTGGVVSSGDIPEGTAVVVMFICNHCPYVQHIHEPLVALAAEYDNRGVAFLAVASNDVTAYPEDGPDHMAEQARTSGYTFPYLFDEDQAVAKLFRAMCTPDFYLFDGGHRLTYHGQFDSSRPKNDIRPDGADLRGAIECVLAGTDVTGEASPSIGCGIKWREGNEPEYVLTNAPS